MVPVNRKHKIDDTQERRWGKGERETIIPAKLENREPWSQLEESDIAQPSLGKREEDPRYCRPPVLPKRAR